MSDEAGKKGAKGKKDKAPSKTEAKKDANGNGDAPAAAAAAAKKEKKEKAPKSDTPKDGKKGKAAAPVADEKEPAADTAAEAKAEADQDAAEAKELADGDAADTNGDDAAAAAEETKEVEKKEKLPPQRPDYGKYLLQKEKLDNELKSAEAALLARNAEIQAKQEARAKARAEKKHQADVLADLKKKTVALYNEAGALQAQIAKEEAATLHVREQLVEAKAGIAELAELDRRLAELGPLLRSKNGAELQRARQEEAQLKSARDRLRLQRDRLTTAAREGTDTKALRDQRQKKTEEANAARDAQGDAAKAFNNARKAENKANSDVEKLIKTRPDVINARNVARGAAVKCKRLYEAQVAAFQKYTAQQTKAAREKDAKPKKVAAVVDTPKSNTDEDDESKKEPLPPPHPFAAELGMTDLLIRYLVGLLPPKSATSEAEDKSSADKQAAVVAARNAQFKGTAKALNVAVSKKGKVEPLWGELKKAAPAKKVKAVVEEPAAKKLIHIPDVFSMFEQLGVQPPLTKDNVAASLDELRALRSSTFEDGKDESSKKTDDDKKAWDQARATRRNTELAKLNKAADKREAEKKAKRRADREAAKAAAAGGAKEEKVAATSSTATKAAVTATPVKAAKVADAAATPAKADKAVEEKVSPKKKGSKKEKAPEPVPEPEPEVVADEAATEETPAEAEAEATATEEVAEATEEAAAAETTEAATEEPAAAEETKADEPAVEEAKATEPEAEATPEPVAASPTSAQAAGASPSKSKKKKGKK